MGPAILLRIQKRIVHGDVVPSKSFGCNRGGVDMPHIANASPAIVAMQFHAMELVHLVLLEDRPWDRGNHHHESSKAKSGTEVSALAGKANPRSHGKVRPSFTGQESTVNMRTTPSNSLLKMPLDPGKKSQTCTA
jgi:hypothetical protein